MSDHGVSEGPFLAFLDPFVPLFLGLLVVTLYLFWRWLESADRSAYIVGTAAAIVLPAWLIGMLVVRFVWEDAALLPSGLEDEPLVSWLIGWAFWGLGLLAVLALLWFTVLPLWLTGAFMLAPQGQVRRRYKRVESSWQFGIATVVAVKALVLLHALLVPWL